MPLHDTPRREDVMTPAVQVPTRSRFGWVQTVVLTLGIALLGLTLLPPAAGAEQSGSSDVSGNGTFMALLC